MNNKTCCICFEEWKPYEEVDYTNCENFNCRTCNEGKICFECFEKNSKEGEWRAWEYLIKGTAIRKEEHFKRTGFTKQMVKGMECVVCKTPNWKQYYHSIIKRSLGKKYALQKQKCLWKAQRGKEIKPCFWVYLKNAKQWELYNEVWECEEDTYYYEVKEAYNEYYKNKHEYAMKRCFKRIRKLKKCKNKLFAVKIQNYKRMIKNLKKENKKLKRTGKHFNSLIKVIQRAEQICR